MHGDRQPRPTTLLFDLSEVLISGLLGVERVLAPRLGIIEEDVLAHLGGEPLRALCRGSLSEDAYLSAVQEGGSWDCAPSDVKFAIRDNFRRTVEGMPELVRDLGRDLPLFLVSDHAREWIAHIESLHPFLAGFRGRVYSYETGLLKDEAGAFDAILERVGGRASECLFVDDNPRNVAQAERAGIRSVRFESRKQLVGELRRAGIAI